MAQKEEEKNDPNFGNTKYEKVTRKSFNIFSEKDDEKEEILPRIKRRRANDNNAGVDMKIYKNARNVESCDICQQFLDNLKNYQNDFCDAVFEDVALTDEKLHLSIDGDIDEDLNPTYKLMNFSVYDSHQHLCRFDTGLIEENIPLYCSGIIIPIYEENCSPECGVTAKNLGPINEWYTTGFDGGEQVLVCISTQFAEYYLIKPSKQYKSFMDPVYEKAYMSKMVIEFITTKDDPTYEDLIDELRMVKPPDGLPHFTEESLLKNVQFICDQIMSLDLYLENSDDFPLLTSACVRSLVNLTGVTVGKTIKPCKVSQNSPIRKQKKSWTTPTMTNLVREVFKKFYPKNLDIKPLKIESMGACGVCEACHKPDCGNCQVCRRKKKSKNVKVTNEICINRKCPNKAIQDADVSSGTDEESIVSQAKSTPEIPKSRQIKLTRKNIKWLDKSVTKTNERIYHTRAQVGNSQIKPGDFIIIDIINPASEQIAQVINMWEDIDGAEKMHINWYLRGRDTILGNVADELELFAIDECTDVSLKCFKRQCTVYRQRAAQNWREFINAYNISYESKKSSSDNFFYQKRYIRDNARFEDCMTDENDVDELDNMPLCSACMRTKKQQQLDQPQVDERRDNLINGRTTYGIVNYKNNNYRPGSSIYIIPSSAFINDKFIIPVPTKPDRHNIDEDIYPEYYRKYFTGDHVKGSNYDTPEPFDIGYVRSIYTKVNTEIVQLNDLWVEFNRMYRSEETHQGSALIDNADINLLYWSDEIYEIPFSKIMGKCYLTYVRSSNSLNDKWTMPHRFYFTQAYDAKKKIFTDPPLDIIEIFAIQDKKYEKSDLEQKEKKPLLTTLDVFAGCGGLSAGLVRASVADVRWAIEKDGAAAQSYQINHPHVAMYQNDCNSLLEDVMCNREQEGFPRRGDVELLCGGPPCQGFSGLNRFNSTQYSYLKNTLLFSFLSYCDYYRPRFIIMENVLNFTLQNKGMMLKIAMYCLLKIGYQCTVAILQAGNFGLPQSRRRTILLGSAPGEQLPLYPEPLHVFSKRTCQLEVVIDGRKFLSNCVWRDSAPYRTICVRDAIADLPCIENGGNSSQIIYGTDAISHFQRKMRGSASRDDYVLDHVCKKMSSLVVARIKNIPEVAGADWRDLPNISVRLSDGTFTKKLEYRYEDKKSGKNDGGKLRGVCSCAAGGPCNPSDRQENTLIPWCLPHTANRQYGWAGTYGRLDWNGFFGTTITNPEPLGKQGRVLHPKQSRVVSVRECARSQGFPDDYCFEGTLVEKYRQIGNAVPPPLAEAIGYEIKKSFEDKRK